MGKPKVTITYAGGSGQNIHFNLVAKVDGRSEEHDGVAPRYIADFLRKPPYRGCVKLDTSGINGTWSKYFQNAAKQ